MQEFTGIEYLKIDIASNFGWDKAPWSERIGWVDAYEDKLEEVVSQADEPALFYAAVQAYRAVQRGEMIGYPISLDATCSGLQILACLTGDRDAAKLCNVVDIGKRADAYTGVYEYMLTKVGGEAKIKRDDTKEAIMTAFYGSTAMPKKIFGEGAMLKAFEDSMAELAPGPWEMNKALLACWDPEALDHRWVLPDNFHVVVKVMSQMVESVNFLNEPFEVPRMVNAPTKEGRSLCANIIHSLDGMIVREIVRRCSYDQSKTQYLWQLIESIEGGAVIVDKHVDDVDSKTVTILWNHYKASGYLSARILDHLWMHNIHLVDLEPIRVLLSSLPERPFQVIAIHDCFRCLPHYGNDLRRQYVLQLAQIAASEMLSFLLSQVLKRMVQVGKLDTSLPEDILLTNYALS